MSKRLKEGERAARRVRSPFDFIPGTKIDDFLGPWVTTATLFAAGLILRNASWGMTVLWSRALGAGGVAVCTATLAYVVSVYAEPRHPFLRRHAIVSTCLWGSILAITLLVGAQKGWVWVLIFGGSTLSLSWNVREVRPLRSKGEDHHGADIDPDPHGIGIDQATIDTIRSEIDRGRQRGATSISLRLRGRGAQGYGEIVKALPGLNNVLSLPAGRVRASAAPDEGSDIADLHIVLGNTLADGVDLPSWDGIRRSVAEGVYVGTYEDGIPLVLCPTGDKSRAPFQLGVMGMARAGKSHAFRIFALALSRTEDAVLWVIDATKASQTVGILAPGIDKIGDTQEKAQYMLESLVEVIRMRGEYLASKGFDEWEPGCGIPALFVWVEEAADILAGSKLWERLSRSSLSTGVFLINSMQRASGTNIPTGARAQQAAGLCFGVQRKSDAQFIFPGDEQLASAVALLGTNQQGTFYASYPGVSELHRTMPVRTPWVDRQTIADEILDNADGMAVPDETISWVNPDSIGPSAVRPSGQTDSITDGQSDSITGGRTVRTVRTDSTVSTADRRTALLSAIERTACPDADGRLSVTPRGLITHLSRECPWWTASMRSWLMGELKALTSGDEPALYRAEHGVYRLTAKES